MFSNVDLIKLPESQSQAILDMKIVNIWEKIVGETDEKQQNILIEEIQKILCKDNVEDTLAYIKDLTDQIESIYRTPSLKSVNDMDKAVDRDIDCFSILTQVPRYIWKHGLAVCLRWKQNKTIKRESEEYRLYHILQSANTVMMQLTEEGMRQRSSSMKEFENIMFSNVLSEKNSNIVEEYNYPTVKELLQRMNITVKEK